MAVTKSGRIRFFTKPTLQGAKQYTLDRFKKQGKNPAEATSRDFTRTYNSLYGNIEREGKNSPIQGLGADIIKTASGCSFDKNGVPFLWHTLEPLYGAQIINEVYDELVIEADESNAKEVLEHVEDAMARAGAEFVSSVVMKADGKIDRCWNKG